MKRWVIIIAAILFVGAAAIAVAQTIIYLSSAPSGVPVSDTDTTWWCQVAAGCGAQSQMVRKTAPELKTYFQNGLQTALPPVVNGNCLTGQAGLPAWLPCSSFTFISTVSLSSTSFVGGTSGTVGAVSVTMNPPTTTFSGTLSLTGANASDFALSSPMLPRT